MGGWKSASDAFFTTFSTLEIQSLKRFFIEEAEAKDENKNVVIAIWSDVLAARETDTYSEQLTY